MRCFLFASLLTMVWLPAARAQSPDDITKLIERCRDLDSTDLARLPIKFRAGLEPSLLAHDADESAMTVLKDPYQAHGQNKPGAMGWYRLSFELPAKIGAFPRDNGYLIGIESNLAGYWEIYTYANGVRVGSNGTTVTPPVKLVQAFDQPPTAWRSNAPLRAKAGDKFTVVILAAASPLAEGSPDGFALRHLRLRFAFGHTFARTPFFGSLYTARERLDKAKGDELTALQARLKDPLARCELLFKTVESQKIEELTKAMSAASREINEALKK